MTYYIIKIAVTALLIVGISEIAKRSTLLGAVLASLPLTSLLAFIWLYIETRDEKQIAALSVHIFWLVLPSLPLFLLFALLLRLNWGFWPSLAAAVIAAAVIYAVMVGLLARQGVQIS